MDMAGAEIQLLHGAGDGYETDAALFLNVALFIESVLFQFLKVRGLLSEPGDDQREYAEQNQGGDEGLLKASDALLDGEGYIGDLPEGEGKQGEEEKEGNRQYDGDEQV